MGETGISSLRCACGTPIVDGAAHARWHEGDAMREVHLPPKEAEIMSYIIRPCPCCGDSFEVLANALRTRCAPCRNSCRTSPVCRRERQPAYVPALALESDKLERWLDGARAEALAVSVPEPAVVVEPAATIVQGPQPSCPPHRWVIVAGRGHCRYCGATREFMP